MMTSESKEHLRNKVHSRLVRERKSAKEIQEVLESLKARPLIYAEYKAMPQDIASWHEFANSANVDKALDAHKDEQKKAVAKIKNSVERMWTGAASTVESEAAWKAAEQFMEMYPAVRPTDTATGAAFRKYLRANNLDPREVSSYETALQALAGTNQPEIVLSPKAAGVGLEEELGGYSLRSYPKLHLLLQRAPSPEMRKFREAYRPELSADEYKREHLQETGVPHHVKERVQRFAVTLADWHPDFIGSDENIRLIVTWMNENKMHSGINGFEAAYQALSKAGKLELKADAIVQAGKTTMTNYEPRESGEPLAPQKLQAKIRNLSSTELAEFFRNNPGARAAVDSM
jgi:hypothetical protein